MIEEFPALPWFIGRMMTDSWHFGFYLNNGCVIHFSRILAIKQMTGSLWIDVLLEHRGDVILSPIHGLSESIFAPAGGSTASINAAHIVMAFEMAGPD